MEYYRQNIYPYRTSGACDKARCKSVKEQCLDNDRNVPLAMGYIKWQTWQDIYPCDKALMRGTLFCELDKPFTGRGRNYR